MVNDLRKRLIECLGLIDPKISGALLHFREIKNDIYDLDNESEEIQKEFVDKLFDEFFAKGILSKDTKAKKLIMFSQIFGREKALDTVFRDSFAKGLPPIDFLDHAFGKQIAKDIILQNEKRYYIKNIRASDDYQQIMFVNRILKDDIGMKFPTYGKKLMLRFGRYIKYGPEKEDILSSLMENERFTPDDFLIFLKRNIASKNGAHNESLELLRERRKDIITPSLLREKLIFFISQFIGEDRATRLVETSILESGLTQIDVLDSPEKNKNKLLELIFEDETLSSLSLHRKAVIEALIKSWLGV